MVMVMVVVAAAAESAAAVQSKTVWDGVYTEQQAARGASSFTTYCARCHEAVATDGEEGRPLAGRGFWQSYRESTVDYLLDYVSRSMPNGAGGTLSANTYADLVAFILSRNGLPAGAAELSRDSATGVKIIDKSGPGELPEGTLVRVVGCVARKEGGGWVLNSATAPERAATADAAKDYASRPLGTGSYALMFSLTPLDKYVGHRLMVRGLLIGEGGRNGINVSMTESLATTCN
jgi:mono/diheme cytochrome c family protein